MDILKILKGTPWWVFLLFIYLINIGVRSLKDSIVFLPRLFIIPAVFIGLKLKDSSSYPEHSSILYFMCLAIGIIFGYALVKNINIKKNENKLSIKIPGSSQTLILIIAIFTIKYCFGYIKNAMPEVYISYLNLEDVLLGIMSGLFLGRSICYSYKWYKLCGKNY